MVVLTAKDQRGIGEIIRMIGIRRICGCAFIAKAEGISPRTTWVHNAAILPRLLTLQKEQLKQPPLSPCRLRTIGWWPAQMLDPVIGSLIVDTRHASPAIDQCSSPTPIILPIGRRWRYTMGSHRVNPDMEVLCWFVHYQMERQKWSYFK